jgi:hypothetical protein
MMALIQMDYPLRNEPYFVSSFIAGLTEGIKHYLISNNPLTLCDTYWKTKELEKGIMIKKIPPYTLIHLYQSQYSFV